MNIKVLGVQGRGSVETEELWLIVEADDNLVNYMVTDTTYDSKGDVSNKYRHNHRFGKLSVEKGDSICLHTKQGVYSSQKNGNKKTLHHIYWGLNEHIWNKKEDKAYIYKIADLSITTLIEVNYSY